MIIAQYAEHSSWRQTPAVREKRAFGPGGTLPHDTVIERRGPLPAKGIITGTKPSRSSGKPIDERRLSRVMGFIDAHLARSVGVADLAAVACMSTAHFARLFKAATGRSPHEFVNRKRVELACRMLADRHRPIAEIALSTGFSSQSNFARAFRHAMGMTPGAYRASRLAGD
jgi:AraC-like DNA-binding protein